MPDDQQPGRFVAGHQGRIPFGDHIAAHDRPQRIGHPGHRLSHIFDQKRNPGYRRGGQGTFRLPQSLLVAPGPHRIQIRFVTFDLAHGGGDRLPRMDLAGGDHLPQTHRVRLQNFREGPLLFHKIILEPARPG